MKKKPGAKLPVEIQEVLKRPRIQKALREGMESLEAGRTISLEELEAEMREKHR